jgi:riboflavin kinase / FMN adenylyltransferase
MTFDRPPFSSVVTIGFFDGVHLGHRQLIAAALNRADELSLPCVVVTFDRHPASVIRPEFAPRLLTAVDHKLELLEASGVDAVHLVHFDHARARESAEAFIEEVFVGALHASAIVVGESFRFGYERRGDLAMLERLGVGYGFSVTGFGLVADLDTGEVVTSSRIRGLVDRGELESAAALLGRPHEVRGFVTTHPGSESSSIGLAVDTELLLPPEGRYLARLRAGDLEVETTARVAGNLVEIGAFSGSGVIHAGQRCSVAFLESA